MTSVINSIIEQAIRPFLLRPHRLVLLAASIDQVQLNKNNGYDRARLIPVPPPSLAAAIRFSASGRLRNL